jgi:hypothetical protein
MPRRSCAPGPTEVEIVQIRNAPCAVDGDVSLESPVASVGATVHDDAATVGAVDPAHFRPQLDTDAEAAGALDQEIHEIRVERLQRPRTPVDDRDLCAGPRGDVGEFERDVPAPDEDDAPGEGLELEEAVAGREMLGARKGQGSRLRASGDQHVSPDELVIAEGRSPSAHESRLAPERLDPLAGITLRKCLRGRVVSDRLKRMSSGQSMDRFGARTPLPAMSRGAFTASAALTSSFLGRHPRRAQVPPTGGSRSRHRQPASRHFDAAPDATPVPTTTGRIAFHDPSALASASLGRPMFAMPATLRVDLAEYGP